MKETDIKAEYGDYWVGNCKTHYSVFVTKGVVSESESSYPFNDDGLSCAVARAKYLYNQKVRSNNLGKSHLERCCVYCGKVMYLPSPRGWTLARNKPFQYVCNNEECQKIDNIKKGK